MRIAAYYSCKGRAIVVRGTISIILLALLALGGCSSSGSHAGDAPLVPLPSPPIARLYPIDITFAGLPNGPLAGPTNVGGVDITGNGATVNDGLVELLPGEVFFTPPSYVTEAAFMVNSTSQSSAIIGLDSQNGVVAQNFTWMFGDYYFFTISSPQGAIRSVKIFGQDSAIERAIFSRPFSVVEFEQGVSIPLADSASDMLAADLDGDGKPDLAVASPASNRIYIAYGNGAGGVARYDSIITAGAPGKIIAASLNAGDKMPDLAVTLPGAGAVEIFKNQGGVFTSAGVYAAGASSSAIAAADVNSDGVADLAVAGSGGVGILINNGDATFGAPAAVPGLTGAVADLALGDIDLDGKADIVALRAAPNSLDIWKGNGAGSFAQTSTISLGAQAPIRLAVKTLDWDKYPDVTVALGGNPNFRSYINQKNGALKALQSFMAVNGAAADITLPDVNADGFADMVFADADNGNMAVFVCQLMGQFQLSNITQFGFSPVAVRSADFDGDRRNDVFAVDNTGTAHVYLNRSH